jgi:hypothetical protein
MQGRQWWSCMAGLLGPGAAQGLTPWLAHGVCGSRGAERALSPCVIVKGVMIWLMLLST